MLEIQDLGSSEEKIGNQMTLFYGGKTGFGIELRMALPKNLIYASIRSTVQPFAVIFLIVIGITAIVVFAVSMRMTRPLKFIGEDIRNLETADWMRRCGNLIQESLMRSAHGLMR